MIKVRARMTTKLRLLALSWVPYDLDCDMNVITGHGLLGWFSLLLILTLVVRGGNEM